MAAVRNANMSPSDAYLAKFEAQANQAPTTDERPTSFECCGCLSPNRATIGEDDSQTSQVAYRALEVEQTPPVECCLDSNSNARVCAKILVVIATVAVLGLATFFTGGLAVVAVGAAMKALWIGLTIAGAAATLGSALILPFEYKMGTDTGHNCNDSLYYIGHSLIFLFDGIGRACDFMRDVVWYSYLCNRDPGPNRCPSCEPSPSVQDCADCLKCSGDCCHVVTKCLADCCSASNCQGCELPSDCNCFN